MATRDLQKRINKIAGSRRNMNGAGVGARLVAKREKAEGGGTKVVADKSQLGSRNQRYRDLRRTFGLSAG